MAFYVGKLRHGIKISSVEAHVGDSIRKTSYVRTKKTAAVKRSKGKASKKALINIYFLKLQERS